LHQKEKATRKSEPEISEQQSEISDWHTDLSRKFGPEISRKPEISEWSTVSKKNRKKGIKEIVSRNFPSGSRNIPIGTLF